MTITAVILLPGGVANAVMPPPGPSSGTVGVEGRIPSPPPTRGATIITPANGQSFTSTPITVRGSCPSGTLVRIYSNNIFIGSTTCTSGNYSVDVSLFSGRNDLVARVSDSLDQSGPDSNTVTVNYSDPQFAQFGSQVLLTSQYGRRAANPNDTLDWPIVLSSGVGPYAFSVDWGDGTATELKSEEFAGLLNYSHIYKNAGVYKVIFKVADKNGSSAYLQVIAVINGQTDGNGGSGSNSGTDANGKNTSPTIITKTKVNWQIPVVLIAMLPFGFWLGRHAELVSLRKRLEREYK
jgi:hypothetical protein